MGTFTETFKTEMAAQKAAKAKAKEERKKEREAKGSLLVRACSNIKAISIAGIYSIVYALFVYCVILSVTMYLPLLLGVIVSFFNTETVFVMAVECSSLFFTAWVFVLSFVIIRKATRCYTKGIKRLFSTDTK